MASVRSTANILSGFQEPAGKLPITVGQFAYGSGLDQTLPPQELAFDDKPGEASDAGMR